MGTSHGFDPNGHTTGFIVWINGQGILVDPPPHTGKYLRSRGIRPTWVNRVILTHCHSDHDAGTLHMLSTGEQMELITTKTINASYLRKLNAITGMDMSEFYRFVPVPIGAPVDILGATFEFDYRYKKKSRISTTTIISFLFFCQVFIQFLRFVLKSVMQKKVFPIHPILFIVLKYLLFFFSKTNDSPISFVRCTANCRKTKSFVHNAKSICGYSYSMPI